MRELLDIPSQRIIKILETLAVHEGWTTLPDLSSAVNASERTIAKDISRLRKQWGTELNIESSKKNGIRLLNQTAASIGLVFTDLFKHSTALRWIKELLFHPNKSIEFYGNKLFVSRSTLIRLLPKINKFFASRKMEIRCQNNQYQFLGKDEQYLRDFSASFLLELYGLNLQEYDTSVDLKIIYHLISSALVKNLDSQELDLAINDDISVAYQMMFYLISLIREGQGYMISSDYPVENEIDTKDLVSLQRYFLHLKIDNLRPIHEFMFNQHNGWSSDEEKNLLDHEAKSFFERLFLAIPISLDENSLHLLVFILESIYLNAKLRPYKTSTLFDRIYYFSLSLKRINFPLYQIIESNLNIFSQRIHFKMSSRISDLIFWMCLVYPELYRFLKSKTVLLIDDFGRPHAKFLAKILSDFFNQKNCNFLQIDIAPYPDILTSAKLQNYDALITTIPNLPISHPHIFLVNDYPTHNNLFTIYKALTDDKY